VTTEKRRRAISEINDGPLLGKLKGQMCNGELDRREFVRLAALLGVSAGSAYATAGRSATEAQAQVATNKLRKIHFKDIDFLVAYDASADAHFYLRSADLVVNGNQIAFIGKAWKGQVDEVVDCRHRMVMPGFVNIHTHASAILENKGLLDEVSSKLMGSTVLFEYNRILRMDPPYRVAKLNAALHDLARSGSTTVVDLAYAYPGWIETLAASGLRTCAGAQYYDALHWSPDGHTMTYQWDLSAGQKAMRSSMEAVDAAMNHPSR
jgi:5-methylthioadenosine/S-adenosylhomocysteine deaminase